MKYYIQEMLDEFPYQIKCTYTAPWNEKLFKVDESSKKLNEEK